MTAGVAEARANSFLNIYRNVAYTAVANVFVKLHIGDPGVDGLQNPSLEATRVDVDFDAPSGGSMSKAAASTPQWANWTAGSETISHISLWDAATVGTFQQSLQLTSPVAVVDGNTLTLNSLTLTAAPIAAT